MGPAGLVEVGWVEGRGCVGWALFVQWMGWALEQVVSGWVEVFGWVEGSWLVVVVVGWARPVEAG